MQAPEPAPRRLWALPPPFILAFVALAAARGVGLIPAMLLTPIHDASALLTVLAMAALGLGVDLRAVTAAGPRVTGAVTLSLAVLGAMAVAVVRLAVS